MITKILLEVAVKWRRHDLSKHESSKGILE